MTHLLINILSIFSKSLGDNVEIVLHAADGEILWISNGNLTGRELGDKNDPEILSKLKEQLKSEGDKNILVYPSYSTKNVPLKSTVALIECNNSEYFICLNQDLSAYFQIENTLVQFTSIFKSEPKNISGHIETIDDMISNILSEEILSITPLSLNSKETKLKILKKLNEKGILSVKGAMPKICAALHIGQATYYNYIKELNLE